jgi:uncharacterized protein YidB (DUF937 family)
VKALALLAATVALALLLAALSHQTWPPIVIAILGTLPALYLAWLALPGAIRPPELASAAERAYGRPAGRWNPAELGVHPVIGGGPMPVYVRRPHDELLRAVLDPEVAASRLVVVRGGSSTGKTRAAYEAVADVLTDWQLDYPLDRDALAARLEAGVPLRTVLWLGELRQYADASGWAAALGSLADLLNGEGHLVITTMWPEHWHTYTAAARAGPGAADPAGVAGRLLARLPELTSSDPALIDPSRGGVIDVPDRFTAADLEAVSRVGDPVLVAAAAAAVAAGQGGQVTQYLAGVPDLLRRYAGRGGDPYGQALITAAMDATRLGHLSPLPAALLQEAGVGYLTRRQRTAGIEGWRDKALAWATEELKGAVRALQPVPPVAGTGVIGYRVADYLDQYGRRTRQDRIGPASLWDALMVRTASVRDLTRLAQAARDRGLYRHAAALWTNAAALGNERAAGRLISHLRQVNLVDVPRAARWVLNHASFEEPSDVALLLRELWEAGADEAVCTLLSRDPAGSVSLEDPWGIGMLLEALRLTGAEEAVRSLTTRAGSCVSLESTQGIGTLLTSLHEAGADEAVRVLATRVAGHASVDDTGGIGTLLEALREVGAGEAVRVLAIRAADGANVDDPRVVTRLLEALREAGVSDAVHTLLVRGPAGRVRLDDGWDVAKLLSELREAGASDAVRTLATRAAAHFSLHQQGAAWLLWALYVAGASETAQSLIDGDPAVQATIDNRRGTAWLLTALHEAGVSEAAQILMALHPEFYANLDTPSVVTWLLRVLLKAEASDAVWILASGAARHVVLDDPRAVAELLGALLDAGASDAVQALLTRDPVSYVRFDDAQGLGMLLRALTDAGATDAARALLARDPVGRVSYDDCSAITVLLKALREAGADEAVRGLAARAANRVNLDHTGGIAELVEALLDAGADEAGHALAVRAANAGMFALFLKVHPAEASIYRLGREPDDTPSQSWKWQEPKEAVPQTHE